MTCDLQVGDPSEMIKLQTSLRHPDCRSTILSTSKFLTSCPVSVRMASSVDEQPESIMDKETNTAGRFVYLDILLAYTSMLCHLLPLYVEEGVQDVIGALLECLLRIQHVFDHDYAKLSLRRARMYGSVIAEVQSREFNSATDCFIHCSKSLQILWDGLQSSLSEDEEPKVATIIGRYPAGHEKVADHILALFRLVALARTCLEAPRALTGAINQFLIEASADFLVKLAGFIVLVTKGSSEFLSRILDRAQLHLWGALVIVCMDLSLSYLNNIIKHSVDCFL